MVRPHRLKKSSLPLQLLPCAPAEFVESEDCTKEDFLAAAAEAEGINEFYLQILVYHSKYEMCAESTCTMGSYASHSTPSEIERWGVRRGLRKGDQAQGRVKQGNEVESIDVGQWGRVGKRREGSESWWGGWMR